MSSNSIPEVTDRDVFITRSFAAPVDVVWKFWTQPELLAQWFGPEGITVSPDSIAIEAREGGSWNLTMKDDAGEYPITATITKLVLNEYLEMTLRAESGAGLLENEILRIQFHDHGEKTRLTLHQGPFAPEMRDMTRDGWNQSFQKLDTILEGAEA
ncbi:SRPBCC family protein [Glaciibacter superstes]|uniref:SRPBCC family protein n=1 Tax=Glaciibacter superstes TaxID=501023 RepID=UPI0003B6E4B8|nr:SRPBCC domain-containing protein [Glaciibacter superstes]